MKAARIIGHIGSTELISLTDQAVFDVPAKIDTGADSSAIWATNIREQDGVLSFVLFDKHSPFYSGKVNKTRDYKLSSIKNSFGTSEFRYKVRLKTKIAGRVVNVRFTLADRSNNRYPVLIGRKTIAGKFLVDVSKKIDKDTHKILLISLGRTDILESYVDGLEAKGNKLDITATTYEDLDFFIGRNSVIRLAESGQDIADFDMVYFKTTVRHLDIAAATAQYLIQRGVPFIDQAIRNYPSTSKLFQYVVLAGGKIPVPTSLYAGSTRLKNMYSTFVEYLGLPFVLKDIHGKKGDNNYMIADEESYLQAISAARKAKVRLIGQAFIPNDGDYRVLVLGRRIELVIKRTAASVGSHLNNTSQGGSATLVDVAELPAAVQKHSITAASMLERQIAGVDMVQDKSSGKWYCFEVNDGPQLATGTFLPEKHAAVATFLERKIRG